MALNKRQETIITMMEDLNDWITGKELSKLLNVSDRTIRCDINVINHHYDQPLVLSDQHHGYTLDRTLMRSLEINVEHPIPQTPQERSIYILQELLFQKRELNLGNMQDEVFVSGYSIENDLKRIRNMLSQYDGLKLVRSKSFIHLEGSEKSKRQLYKDLLEKEAKGNFLNMNKLATLYQDFDFLFVKQILDETLESYDFSIREMALPMLMMHIGVAIERIIHHNFVQTEVKSEALKRSKEYRIAQEFFEKVSKKIRIEVVDDEIVRLALLLLGKRSSEFTGDKVRIKDQDVHITKLVEELLEDLFEQFEIDVRDDGDLQIGLQMHLQALFERQIQGIAVDNVYLQEIKKKYPLVFEMGVRSGKFLHEKAGLQINENELGFLALHLGAAYERSRQSGKYRVLMIYPDDQSSSRLCRQKVEQRFSSRLEIIDHMSVFVEERVKQVHPDLILTTLPLVHNLDIMTEQISVFMNNEDESRIFYALNDLDKLKSRDDFQNMIEEMIRPEFFFYDHPAKSPEDIIHHMCNVLEEYELIPKEFRNDVLKREEMSSTSFIFGFAIPHALTVCAKRSCLSIAVLKHPIPWGEYDVKLVILIGIKEDDKNLMRIFFDWLDHVVSDSNKFTALLKSKTYQEFIHQVLQD